MPRANRTIAPITYIPPNLTGDMLLYYLNSMIEQINSSFSDIDILESAVRGEEGYTATIASNLDVQGNTVMNLRTPSAAHEALPLGGATALLDALLPLGVIILWSGSLATIPAGWQLCNGTNGTPDLRDRFVIGAGTTYAVNATGGATTANLAHTHSTPAGVSGAPSATTTVDDILAGLSVAVGSATHTHTTPAGTSGSGGSAAQSILNPYFSLAYIMRVS